MDKYQIEVLFARKAGFLDDSAQMDTDSLIRLLRKFEPSPFRVYVAGPGCAAVFNCEAETPFAAGVIATDLFDGLKAHLTQSAVQPQSWQIL